MDNGMISKIQKAKLYAQERDRVHIESLRVRVDGENNSHEVEFKDSEWNCDCNFFQTRNVCSHTMALERILDGVVIAAETT